MTATGVGRRIAGTRATRQDQSHREHPANCLDRRFPGVIGGQLWNRLSFAGSEDHDGVLVFNAESREVGSPSCRAARKTGRILNENPLLIRRNVGPILAADHVIGNRRRKGPKDARPLKRLPESACASTGSSFLTYRCEFSTVKPCATMSNRTSRSQSGQLRTWGGSR
jgi:hypothetical protein